MKEQMTYVAIDADNVGESVGNAVLSDDTSQLSKLSEAINTGVQIFSKWAEFNGGSVISSGSDEAIFQVPVTSIPDLENLKDEYVDKTGFTISIGIGEKVSDAAKALIYAKMNGKNQITDYSPEMEQAMQQAISGGYQEQGNQEEVVGESEGDIPEHEKHLNAEDKAIHDSTEMQSDEEEVQQEQVAEEGDSGATGDMLPEGDPEENVEEDMEYEEEENIEGEKEIEGDAIDDMSESNSVMDEDIDLDGEPDVEEDHGEILPSDDLDGDGDVEHEEVMAERSDSKYSDEEDYNDEVLDEDSSELSDSIAGEMGEEEMLEDGMEEEYPEEGMEEGIEEGMEEEYPEEGMEGEMEEEYPEEEMEEEMGEEYPEEEMGEEYPEDGMEGEGDPTEDLKTVIFESLQSFKENREYLEMVSQENPELYDALIYTLQAMIEMARELGYGNMEEGMEEGMEDDMLNEEDEVMGEEVMDEGEAIEEEMEDDMNPDDFAVDSEEEEEEMLEDGMEEEYPEEDEIEKTENFVSLLRKTNAIISKMNLLKDEDMSIKEMKEKVKKKLEQQKQGASKKKGGKKKNKSKSAAEINEKKKNKGKSSGGGSNSFCAKSHQKMTTSGKDCRSNDDKNSPLCSARKKFSCRGKNEEKGGISKSEDVEKLSKFLKKKDKKLEKSKLATKQTTKHTTKPHNPEGTQKGYKVKDIDNETGRAQWIDGSRGLAEDPAGDPIGPKGNSPISIRKPKSSPAVKQ